MKKLFCLFTAIITIMSFAACGNGDIESGSEGQEISKTEISRQDEQSFEDESSFAEVSEPVSEEISEPVSEEASEQPPEVSEPQQSIDDEPSTEYRVINAYSAENLREKLTELAQKIDDPSTVMTIAERELYAPLSAILAEGYIINPIIGDTQIESAPEDPYGALEMIFFKNHKVSLTYYCRNSDKVSANVQITYPNEEMLGMIQKHGIDGYRMFYAGNEKTADKLTAEEVEKTGFSSISVCEISCGGKKYEAIKYVKKIKGDYNRVVFMHDGKVFVITYLYIDDDFAATHDIDDILGTIKLEKLYFDGSSKDVSRDEPQPSIDPEDFPYRRFSAHSAAELVNKLKEANEKINGDKASDFNMKDIDYLAPLSGILAQGFIFNPSVDGIYAENNPEEAHGKIEMVFDGDQSVTAIYYCRNDDDVRVMLQITYPNESMNQLISQYGVDGYCMYVSKSDRPISQMTDQEKETAGIGFRNGILGNIVIDGQSYETFKFPSGDGENNLILICDGMPILIEYYYKSDELKATHDVDDILDTIKLEKLYFDKAE